MPLPIADRLYRMPYGAQKRVADAEEVKESWVSAVMRDAVHPKTEATRAKLRRVQAAIAAELGLPIEDVFDLTNEEAEPLAARAS